LHDPAYGTFFYRPRLDGKFIIRKGRFLIVYFYSGYIEPEPSLYYTRIIKSYCPEVLIAGIFQIMKIYGIIDVSIGIALIGANP